MIPGRPESSKATTVPPLADRVTPDSAHKFCAGALFATAAVMLLQLAVMATLSDDQVRSILERTPFYSMLSPEKKDEAFRLARQELTSGTRLAGKSLGALLLGAIGVGLLRGKRSPTRVLAALAAVLFGVASAFVIANVNALVNSLESSIGLLAWIDLAFAVLVPVAFVCCFITAGRKLWKGPLPALALPRLRRPPGSPPAGPA